jgi:inosine-uridine nucleoside N-ribohydrolase
LAIPVILDTDIGFDVDDVWALAFLLMCPELDVKLITTTTGDTVYRARLVAKLLDVAGRQDIPIGIGIPLDESPRTHATWLGDYTLADYPGPVIVDGIGALCDTITTSADPITLICIGPLPNIAAALAREPKIADNSRFVGMHGSLRVGYQGVPKPMREYNVKQHSLSCQAAFQAPWEKVITPLDTCGTVVLAGERFESLKRSNNPLTQAALANHYEWFEAVGDWPLLQDLDPQQQTSVLFDSVAIYLAISDSLLDMENLPITVTDDGKTLIDETGDTIRCATRWLDQDGFLDLLVDRLA